MLTAPPESVFSRNWTPRRIAVAEPAARIATPAPRAAPVFGEFITAVFRLKIESTSRNRALPDAET